MAGGPRCGASAGIAYLLFAAPLALGQHASPPPSPPPENEGQECRSCAANAECETATTMVVPSDVHVLNATDFGRCPNVRDVIVMSQHPIFEAGSFRHAPRLERIRFGNESCVPSETGSVCSFTAEPGAMNSCVGPTDGFGYSTSPLLENAVGCNSCQACGAQPAQFTARSTGPVTRIGQNAFSGCANLRKYVVNSSIPVVILESAFSKAPVLQHVSLGNLLTFIGPYAFENTASLLTVDGGSALEYIGSRAFAGSAASNAVIGGVFPVSNALVDLQPAAFAKSRFKIFDTGKALAVVSHSAFRESQIVVVTLGISITRVEYDAFRDCQKLSKVSIISTTLTAIDENAFSGCTRLRTLLVPGPGLQELGHAAFVNTKALRGFSLGNVHTADFSTAFRGSNCTGDPDFEYQTGGVYANCELAATTPPSCLSATSPPECETAVSIIATDATIGTYAFRTANRSAVPMKLTIGNDVETIEASAFSAYSGDGPHPVQLESLAFESGRTKNLNIGDYAFEGAAPTGSLIFPDYDAGSPISITIGRAAFVVGKFTSIDFRNVVSIGEDAFSQCTSLAAVYFHPGLESIGSEAFYGAPLSEVVFPDTLTSIGAWAFSATNLVRVKFEGVPPMSQAGFFYNTQQLTTLLFPAPAPASSETQSLTSALSYSHLCEFPAVNCSELTTADQVCNGELQDAGDICSVNFSTLFAGHPHVTPAHLDPGPPPNPRNMRMPVGPIPCVPCDPSATAVEGYTRGRTRVPDSIAHIFGTVLDDCPGVTSVTVSPSTRFSSAVASSAFESSALETLVFDPPLSGPSENHHSYTARCIMNKTSWWVNGSLESGGYGTIVAREPIARDRIRCLPCTTDGDDLTVSDSVLWIPPWAFSNCSIPGTVHFHIDGSRGPGEHRGVEEIAEHAFDLTRPGSVLGSVVLPYTLVRKPAEPRFEGLGEFAFRAYTFRKFIVGVPENVQIGSLEESLTQIDGFPNMTRDWWVKRVVVQEPDATTGTEAPCYRSGQSPHPIIAPTAEPVLKTVNSSGCASTALEDEFNVPKVRLARLFGVCDCEEMAPGCYYNGNVNPKATLTGATTDFCPGLGPGSVGPVILPYYDLLLPTGSTPISVNVSGTAYNKGESAACALNFSVYISADTPRSGCDICDASLCAPAGLGLSSRALAFVDKDDEDDGLFEEPPSPPAPPPPTEEPFPVAAIVVISVGSAFILVLLGLRLWRRRRGQRRGQRRK